MLRWKLIRGTFVKARQAAKQRDKATFAELETQVWTFRQALHESWTWYSHWQEMSSNNLALVPVLHELSGRANSVKEEEKGFMCISDVASENFVFKSVLDELVG